MENYKILPGEITGAIDGLDSMWLEFCRSRTPEELGKNQKLLAELKAKIEEATDYLVENAGVR